MAFPTVFNLHYLFMAKLAVSRIWCWELDPASLIFHLKILISKVKKVVNNPSDRALAGHYNNAKKHLCLISISNTELLVDLLTMCTT